MMRNDHRREQALFMRDYSAAVNMILALAGRRIDSEDANKARFPAANVEEVRKAVRALLITKGVTAVVSAAACGADLIALSEAGGLNLRRRVILPFAPKEFREKSVTDRPGEWGAQYDSIVDEVSAKGDLIVMNNIGTADPFTAANQRIVAEAVQLGNDAHEAVTAMIIWDGIEGDAPDYTAEFNSEARRQGLEVFEIRTL